MRDSQFMTVIYLMLVLVVLPALIGYFVYAESLEVDMNPSTISIMRRNLRHMFHGGVEPGDFLIYRKTKVSARPGPGARNVQASENGDDYYYEVDKYWRVTDVLDDGRLVAVTRRGKQVYVTPEDRNVRRAGWFEALWHRRRFPAA
jgi:hypothetical protein